MAIFYTDSGSISILEVSSSFLVSGSATISGSLTVTQGITGSFSGSISNAVSSSYALTASYALSSSFATSASYATTATSASFASTASFAATASFINPLFQNVSISGSAGSTAALTVYKSGSTVMSIQGSQGQLFTIVDSLSGSLFSANNISGLPVLEVFSDNTVVLGDYASPTLTTTKKIAVNAGSTVIYSLSTASYDGAFFDYTLRSGSNARAGQIMAIWSGSSANYVDNSTTDFGDTSGFIFGVIVSGSNMVLSGSASTSGWTLKTVIRSI